MAYAGKTMTKIGEMLRLCGNCGMSIRQAGRATRTSHRIVGLNLKRYLAIGITWEFDQLSD